MDMSAFQVILSLEYSVTAIEDLPGFTATFSVASPIDGYAELIRF